ncbi:MAG: tetratricopeptide repeat protein [Myxococcota bacterium]
MTTARWMFALLGAALLITAPDARAESLWSSHREDCDDTAFAEPDGTALDQVRRCVKLWQAYRDVDGVKGAYRERVVRAMERLYTRGSDADAHLARQALQRMKVSELPSRRPAPTDASPATEAGSEAPPPEDTGREECDVPEPDRRAVRKADRYFDKGYRYYEKGKHDRALQSYQKAVEAAPGWPKGRYNAAALYALKGDAEQAVRELWCLTDIGNEEALEYLKMARTDSDFEPIRDDSAEFKEATGYARIKIGNSLGEYGEDNVYNLDKSLEELGYPVAEVTEAPKEYGEPHIWFKPAAKRTVYFIMKVISHPDIQTHPITWEDEEYDVLIAWGDAVEEGKEPAMRVRDPRDAEDKLNELAREEDRMLREPEKAAREVEDVVETPGRMVDDAKGTVDRVEKTKDTIEKTGDAVKKLGF